MWRRNVLLIFSSIAYTLPNWKDNPSFKKSANFEHKTSLQHTVYVIWVPFPLLKGLDMVCKLLNRCYSQKKFWWCRDGFELSPVLSIFFLDKLLSDRLIVYVFGLDFILCTDKWTKKYKEVNELGIWWRGGEANLRQDNFLLIFLNDSHKIYDSRKLFLRFYASNIGI